MTNYYKILAGGDNVYAEDFLSNGYIGIDYDFDKSLKGYPTSNRDSFRKEILKEIPEGGVYANKLWRIYQEMSIGDILIFFMQKDRIYKLGKVTSDYYFDTDTDVYYHRRKVDWNFATIKKDHRMSDELIHTLTNPQPLTDVTHRSGEIEALLRGEIFTESEVELETQKELNEFENIMNNLEGCIYVYTFPIYEQNPKEPYYLDDKTELMNTYYKIGQTTKTARERVYNQTKTAHPEPPHILRVYELNENHLPDKPIQKRLEHIEKIMHNVLKQAGHKEAKQAGVGNEWFVTNIEFLDSIASLLNLTIHDE